MLRISGKTDDKLQTIKHEFLTVQFLNITH